MTSQRRGKVCESRLEIVLRPGAKQSRFRQVVICETGVEAGFHPARAQGFDLIDDRLARGDGLFSHLQQCPRAQGGEVSAVYLQYDLSACRFGGLLKSSGSISRAS